MKNFNFNQRFDELTPVLNAFAYNLTQDVDAAKDLFQETAYRAMKNREKFDPGTNLKAWLFTIMKNIFINNYRRKKKANVIADSTDNMFYINSGKDSISNRGEANVLIKELKNMIEKLEDSIRVPFLMHYQGFKYQEIADKFDLPLGTVKSRIFFARRELKSQIKNRYKHVDEMLLRA
ncbi:MAG: RNA polymerase sigma factor [Bacteroidota bacterium]